MEDGSDGVHVLFMIFPFGKPEGYNEGQHIHYTTLAWDGQYLTISIARAGWRLIPGHMIMRSTSDHIYLLDFMSILVQA